MDKFLFKDRFSRYLFFCMCLLLGFVINGAVPFLATPTLLQALWTTGFSQSFLNNSLFSIYAHNFGIPEPAAIAFGLIGAWTSAFFIWLGLHPSDAYSCMVLIWLLVAFVSAFKIGLMLRLSFYQSTFVALVWVTMPVIWAHAGYSMLSLGIALLSFYFLNTFKLFFCSSENTSRYIANSFSYFIAVFLAVFMDGYTFMMFAIGSSILFCVIYFAEPAKKKYLLKLVLPLHFFSFFIAYIAFAFYVGKSHYEPANLNFFRAFGADLTFFIIPTEGLHWLADKINFSIKRSPSDWFGDASVWTTTFLLPIFLAGIWSIKYSFRLDKTLTMGMILVAIFAFYMSLGPSLKVNSGNPNFDEIGPLMHSDYAVIPTGSQLFSKYLPGFKSMRASYRWAALGIFSLWLLLVISLGSKNKNTRRISFLFLLGVFIFNLPDLPKKWQENTNTRKIFHKIDEELLGELGKDVKQGEIVAFLPWRNDFLVNYIASRLKINTYNIGGDKNLTEAHKNWPKLMQEFQRDTIDDDFANRLAFFLLREQADVIVLPYISLEDANNWPIKTQYDNEIKKIETKLSRLQWLEITSNKYYAAVRIKDGYENFEEYESLLFPFNGSYPFLINESPLGINRILKKGWHHLEAKHVWSSANASLNLPVTEECQSKKCSADVTFSVFGANSDRPVKIHLIDKDKSLVYRESLTISDSNEYQVSIPLTSQQPFQEIEISIPGATSPHELIGSSDKRVLGIALKRIELVKKIN